jgi:exopolysaccharide production protein ExoQ
VNKILIIAEKCFAILGLTSFPGVLFVFSQVGLFPQVFFTIIKYFIWVATVVLICIFWKKVLILIGQNISIFILVLLACFSSIWSEFPNFTLTIGVEVLMMTLFGLYFATRFNLKQQVELIACTLLIGAFLSVIVAFIFPTVGIHQAFEENPGAWRGIYGQKNALGSMMVLSALTFFTLPKKSSNLYKWFGLSCSLLLILLSNSKTSLVIFVLLILIIALYKRFRWQGNISIIFLNIGILTFTCVTLIVVSYWIELLTGLGRDPTLTGRIPLWGAAIGRLMQRPLLGYGFSAFWAPKSSYAIEVGRAIGTGWIAPNAHNGLLDLALGTGLVGVSLFLISYFTSFIQALKLAYATKNPENLWPLAYLSFLAMINVTESRLLGQFNLCWILYVSLALTINYKSNNHNLIKKQVKKKTCLASN